MKHLDHLVLSAAVGAFAVACGGDDVNTDIYSGAASAALGAAGNEATCATCHAMDGSKGKAGNSFMNIAYLDSYKGGGADLLGAVNACVEGWMGGTALTADDQAYLDIVDFMQSISDSAVTTPNALMPEVLADEAAYEAAYAGGDAAAGAAAYTQYCGGCHDGGLVVGPMAAWAKSGLAAQSIGRIAQKVRTSGPPPSGSMDASDSTPGPMPFFEPQDLAVEDLKNIIAHIKG